MGVLLAHSLVAQTPPELESVRFSGPELTPCPACLCAAPTGEVFVGVDMLGSLGKGPGKGKIVRLVDADGDGKPEKSTIFARDGAYWRTSCNSHTSLAPLTSWPSCRK